MRLFIRHVTRYDYDTPVSYGLQQLRLTPDRAHGQRVRDWTVRLAGATELLRYVDHNGAEVTLAAAEGTGRIEIDSSGTVDTQDGGAGMVGTHDGALPLWAHLRPTLLTEPNAALRDLAASVEGDVNDPSWGHALMEAIRARVAYVVGSSAPTTTAAAALAAGTGVCQDHAHLFVAAARLRGLPARYVSGYLMMDDRIEQDATHAWAEVHVPGIGWTGYDVSNGISPDGRYVRLATGADYAEAAPVRGALFGGAGETLTVQVQVQQQQ